MHFKAMRRALACAILTAATGGAMAGDLPSTATYRLARMSPAQREAVARAFAGQTSRAARPAGADKLDSRPPSLASFATTPPSDVASPFAQLVLRIQADDDLSGVDWVMFALTGPHGQVIWIGGTIEVPAKRLDMRFASDVSANMEPGTWTVDWASVADAADNTAIYEQSDLSAIGPTQFELNTSRKNLVDFGAPEMTQGTVLTPTLSASAVQKGTTLAPIARADFKLKDSGSGFSVLVADWCLADESICFSTIRRETLRGELKETVHSGGSIAGILPGVYLLRFVSASDHAGNAVVYFGSDFSGETDFSTLMPEGHSITITP